MKRAFLALGLMALSPDAYAQDSDMTQPSMIPPPSTDGGINTGTGTVNGSDKDAIQPSTTNPNGDTTKSGGINSGPAGSLPDTGIIPR